MNILKIKNWVLENLLAQSLKYLSFKCKDPSLILSHHTKMPDVAEGICSLSVGEVKVGGSLGLDHQPT